MSEQEDQSQKTEEPTTKRLTEARGKGQVAISREINHWFIILGTTMLIGLFAPGIITDLSRVGLVFLEQPHAIAADYANLSHLLSNTLGQTLSVIALPIIILVVLAALSNIVQHGFLLAPERIKPKLEKISPIKGFKRLFSLSALFEFAKGIFKITIIACVAFLVVYTQIDSFDLLPQLELGQAVDSIHYLSSAMLIGVLAVLTVIAGLDFLFQRFQHLKQLRMSKQEIKEEFKQTEGDPIIKSRLRQIRMEKAKRRMMAQVPEADVVITNPSHYAVALEYKHGTTNAPVCLAKGIDAVAARIRQIAQENQIDIVRNPPLARALYAGVEIGDEIPEEHYQAVAEVISYIYRMKGKPL